ncbi:phosphotransferase [Rhodococcus sp. ARC_M6]|uniref:phosphotransferase n=1 Tax=Rhodococcus sp. ARC_M6 TaxID=2928852 RepID=UPI001FB43667|nr:phosphotransferase [Rhodococcus sp. ARC_M6]MCJ0907484.1 phosphotransferase [Rhodococcus sp. ARC_M6]
MLKCHCTTVFATPSRWRTKVYSPSVGAARSRHGDLHPANVVVSDGTPSGAIDFGDMFAGDPAWDPAARGCTPS